MTENILEKIIRKKKHKVSELKKLFDINLLNNTIRENNTYVNFKEKIQQRHEKKKIIDHC